MVDELGEKIFFGRVLFDFGRVLFIQSLRRSRRGGFRFFFFLRRGGAACNGHRKQQGGGEQPCAHRPERKQTSSVHSVLHQIEEMSRSGKSNTLRVKAKGAGFARRQK